MATTPRPSRSSTAIARRGLSGRHRLGLAAAVVATIGLTAVGVAGANGGQPGPSDAERQIQDQIDAMVDSGIHEDDPKVELLEDQLEELRRGTRADPPPEPGVDLADRVADAQAADKATDNGAGRAQATTGGVPTGPAWQSGTVECEPVPQLLTAEELAGAICVSVPQPDGSSRYVAVGRDGMVRTVAFAADGKVTRSPDRRVPGGVAAGTTTVAPTDAGDIHVTVRGRAPVTVDVG
jgi:hypothetical protein